MADERVIFLVLGVLFGVCLGAVLTLACCKAVMCKLMAEVRQMRNERDAEEREQFASRMMRDGWHMHTFGPPRQNPKHIESHLR